MKCKCKGGNPTPTITFFETPVSLKIVEKHECPVCFQREYYHRLLAEDGVEPEPKAKPKLLGTGVLLCKFCHTMAGVLVLHKGSLKCQSCAREDRV